MKAAMRQVLPPGYVLALFAIMYLLFEGTIILFEARNGAAIPLNVRPGVGILFVAAVMQAGFRVLAFHPFCRPEYCRWLATTPWSLAKPLPLGPIHLVWQDLVVILVVGLLASTQIGLEPTQLLASYLFVYLWLLTTTFPASGQQPIAYVMLLGLGLAVRLWHSPALCATTTILLYPLAYVGLRRSLGAFRSWNVSAHELKGVKAADAPLSQPDQIRAWIGWPFDRLSPRASRGVSLPHRDAVLLSMLAGWWFYALSSLVTDSRERQILVVVIYIPAIVIICIGRWAMYVYGYALPMSLWGRLWTGRWLIPGYDRVLVAPFLAAVCGFLAMPLLIVSGVSIEAAGPIAAALTLLIVTNVGPSLQAWRLTGAHRIVPVQSAQSSYAKGQYVKVG